jgi:prolyl oligopeptidase
MSRNLFFWSLCLIAGVARSAWAMDSIASAADPYLWLEEREGERALEWVRSHDTATLSEICADSNFERFRGEVLAIVNAKDKIPYVSLKGPHVYNFWQDAEHVRGILRRTTREDYANPQPSWDVVLDIDSLNRAEGKSWVFHGIQMLPPDYRLGLVELSDGGKDATVVREFDLVARSFVSGGFQLPEAKSTVSWYDENTLVVGTDFGPGSLTESGYPRIAKLWKRGTPLSGAVPVMEGEPSDVWAGGYVNIRPEDRTFVVGRATSFWESKYSVVDAQLNRQAIPLPRDARIEAFVKGYVIATLHSDWLGVPEGSVIALRKSELAATDLDSKIEVLFQPDSTSTVTAVSATRDHVLVSILRNVKGAILCLSLSDENGPWTTHELALPSTGAVEIDSVDEFSNVFMVTFKDFITPTQLLEFTDPTASPVELKSLPARFDASNLNVMQGEATSADGTRIPYFLVARKNLKLDGTNPTLLYGYGGFRAAETPFYSGSIGKLWLERGGVYVVANIRGGGEFGPRWHRAALLENRQKAFDDFIAVAQDLVARRITSPEHLGISGGSNGGLLVGVAFTQHPELFKAVVCQVPLLDMLRYTKLPPGASWIAEYGDPDSADMRAIIAQYSPYQNVKPGVRYPEVLFVTSTADDRVHPGHARKMAARLEELGNRVYYYEETEGGHAASADLSFVAKRIALEYTYLWKMLR